MFCFLFYRPLPHGNVMRFFKKLGKSFFTESEKFQQMSHWIKQKQPPEVFSEKRLLKISENSQESNCARIYSFIILQSGANGVVPVSFLLILNKFHTLFQCFYFYLAETPLVFQPVDLSSIVMQGCSPAKIKIFSRAMFYIQLSCLNQPLGPL